MATETLGGSLSKELFEAVGRAAEENMTLEEVGNGTWEGWESDKGEDELKIFVSVCCPSYLACLERKLAILAYLCMGRTCWNQLSSTRRVGGGGVAAVPNGSSLFGEAAGWRLGPQ